QEGRAAGQEKDGGGRGDRRDSRRGEEGAREPVAAPRSGKRQRLPRTPEPSEGLLQPPDLGIRISGAVPEVTVIHGFLSSREALAAAPPPDGGCRAPTRESGRSVPRSPAPSSPRRAAGRASRGKPPGDFGRGRGSRAPPSRSGPPTADPPG